MTELVDPQGWDLYWKKKNAGRVLYAMVASFYRKCIIRPILNHYVQKYFPSGTRLVHAGCGSGEVDIDLCHQYPLVGVDISKNAVQLYLKNLAPGTQAIHGSIFALPFADGSVAGLYNLGVMEHFTESEIEKILREFHRALAQHGKMILFWPPEFGLSVRFLHTLKRFIKLFFKKEVQFHPDEVSLIKSRLDVERLLECTDFRLLEYSFGPRDLWTYAIIVAEKA